GVAPYLGVAALLEFVVGRLLAGESLKSGFERRARALFVFGQRGHLSQEDARRQALVGDQEDAVGQVLFVAQFFDQLSRRRYRPQHGQRQLVVLLLRRKLGRAETGRQCRGLARPLFNLVVGRRVRVRQIGFNRLVEFVALQPFGEDSGDE